MAVGSSVSAIEAKSCHGRYRAVWLQRPALCAARRVQIMSQAYVRSVGRGDTAKNIDDALAGHTAKKCKKVPDPARMVFQQISTSGPDGVSQFEGYRHDEIVCFCDKYHRAAHSQQRIRSNANDRSFKLAKVGLPTVALGET